VKGGLTEAKRIEFVASAAGMFIIPGVLAPTGVGMGAVHTFLASCRHVHRGVHGSPLDLLADDIVKEPIPPGSPTIHISDKPGLGFELDEEKVAKITDAFSGKVSDMPEAHTYMMLALDFAIGPSYEEVIVGNSQAKDTEAMFKALRKNFIPNKVVIFRPTDEEPPEISLISKLISGYKGINGRATAYVCQNHICQLPTTNTDRMLELLGV